MNLWFNELNATPPEKKVKQVIGYALLLILAFVLSDVCGLVLVERIRMVVPEVSKTLNAK